MITPRSLVVAEAFGLGIDETQKFQVLDAELKIRPSDVVYITGESGSGKSVLLNAMRADLGAEAVDLSEVAFDPDKPLIETVGKTVEEGLQLLSKVGLNDAFLFLRTYRQLSEGQKYRYRIAKLVESLKSWWLMDEFAACLDRTTAKIIAFNLQQLARQQGKAAIVATTHEDLFEDLAPNVKVYKRYGEEIDIKYYPDNQTGQCSLIEEMKVEEGTLADWRTLSRFHYRGHKTSPPRKIFKLTRPGELCGVIVYSYPPPRCFGRRLVLPKRSLQELNRELSIINRIVIHPKYRSVGLGAKLIHETLPLCGTPFVELIAVMAKFSPFAEKAGMTKVAVQKGADNLAEISNALVSDGFDPKLIGSVHYVTEKLQKLTEDEIMTLKNAFIANKHLRFNEAVSLNRPYSTKAQYNEAVRNASLAALAKLIRIFGVLSQEKIYLFWPNPNLTKSKNSIDQ